MHLHKTRDQGTRHRVSASKPCAPNSELLHYLSFWCMCACVVCAPLYVCDLLLKSETRSDWISMQKFLLERGNLQVFGFSGSLGQFGSNNLQIAPFSWNTESYRARMPKQGTCSIMHSMNLSWNLFCQKFHRVGLRSFGKGRNSIRNLHKINPILHFLEILGCQIDASNRCDSLGWNIESSSWK